MSAERLRQAADRLDELIAAATPGRWWTEGATNDGVYARVAGGRPNGEGIAQAAYFNRRSSPANAAYIAAMHPGVGKALAEWLRVTSWAFATYGEADQATSLAVADAILGGTS